MRSIDEDRGFVWDLDKFIIVLSVFDRMIVMDNFSLGNDVDR